MTATANNLAVLVARFGGELKGVGHSEGTDIKVTGVATLRTAGAHDLAFLANPKYRADLAHTRAAAVILTANDAPACPVPAIVTAQPYLYFARVSTWLNPPPRPPQGVHASSVCASPIPADCSVGAQVSIGAGCAIGAGCIIGAGCALGDGVTLGAGSRLYPRVTIYDGCVIGARALIHSGVVIGADGFGFAPDGQGNWVKIAQTGRVIIGDDVEIGANTTIDRGALEDTIIGNGVKLDNQIQIGHNVRIGDGCALAGCVGIAGSTVIGRRCTFGGSAMILGHLEIADEVHIAAGTMVAKSVRRPGLYAGANPLQSHEDWRRNFAHLRHLDQLAHTMRALEARLKQVEDSAQKTATF